MIKRALYILLMLMVSGYYAQTRFIEVEVNDTICLMPVSFDYEITINDSYNFKEESVFDPLAMDNKSNENIMELKKLLEIKKYSYKALNESSVEINNNPYFRHKGFSIPLKSIEEAKKIKKELDIFNFVSASCSNVKYYNENKAEEILIKRLLDKAKQKANLIAGECKVKLGAVLEVRDMALGGTNSAIDVYTSLSRLKFPNTEGDNLIGRISRSLVVKFAVE